MCLLYLRFSLGLRARELAVADNFCENVRLAKDQHLVGTDLDLRSAVLAEDDLVILGDVHGNVLPVFVPGTGTYGEDAAALRLLLCRVGQHDAADGLLLFLEDFHDQAVTKRLQVHPHPSCSDDFVTSTGTLTARVPRDCTVPSARSARGYVPLCYKVGVRREFSAGGVVVRNLRGRPVVAAIRPAGKPEGTWALPKGLIGPETEAPALEAESRLRRGIRYSHRTGLYAALGVAIATVVVLILLIARNTRQVKVDYVFGSSQTRLIWLVIVSAITGWVLGIVTAFLIRRRTRWRRPT